MQTTSVNEWSDDQQEYVLFTYMKYEIGNEKGDEASRMFKIADEILRSAERDCPYAALASACYLRQALVNIGNASANPVPSQEGHDDTDSEASPAECRSISTTYQTLLYKLNKLMHPNSATPYKDPAKIREYYYDTVNILRDSSGHRNDVHGMLKNADEILRSAERDCPYAALASACYLRQALLNGGNGHNNKTSNKSKPAKDNMTRHQNEIKIVDNRISGIEPTEIWSIPEDYKILIGELNELVHHNLTMLYTDSAKIRKYYTDAINILKDVFLSIEWMEKIIRLAKLSDPQRTDAYILKKLLKNDAAIHCFVDNICSHKWLDQLRAVKLPTDDFVRLVFLLSNRLKQKQLNDKWHTKLVALVCKKWNGWISHCDKKCVGCANCKKNCMQCKVCTKDCIKKCADNNHKNCLNCKVMCTNCNICRKKWSNWNSLGMMALNFEDDGLQLLVKILRKNNSDDGINADALAAYNRTQPSNPQIIDVADLLLNHNVVHKEKFYDVAVKLVAGVTSSSSHRIIKLLASKLKARTKNLEETRHKLNLINSITDIKYTSIDETYALIECLRQSIEKASLHMSTSDLTKDIECLPIEIKFRFMLWLYSRATDMDCCKLGDYLVEQCHQTIIPSCDPVLLPRGEVDLLLDRIVRDCDVDTVAARMMNLLGDVPRNIGKIDNIPQWFELDLEDRIRIIWAKKLGERVILDSGWSHLLDCIIILNNNDGGSANDTKYLSTESEVSGTQEECNSGNPEDRAIRFKNLVLDGGKKQNASYLPDVVFTHDACIGFDREVGNNVGDWTKNPLRIVSLLQHPICIKFYFQGLTDKIPANMHVDKLILAIQFASTHPYFGSCDWADADTAGMELLSYIAKYGFQMSRKSLEYAWNVAERVVDNRTTATTDGDDDRYFAALAKPHTCALHALCNLVCYARRRGYGVPESALKTLEGALHLEGPAGIDSRVILAANVSILRRALPDWVDRVEPVLFSDGALGNTDQMLLEAHLKHDGLDEQIMKKYHAGVLRAVKNKSHRAMERLLLSMLLNMRGYEPKYIAKHLHEMEPGHVLLAWQPTAVLCGKYIDMLPYGVKFWRAVLELNPKPEALQWCWIWATVTALEQYEWEDLTLRTCKLAQGKLSTVLDISERIRSSETLTPTGLEIMILLVKTYPSDTVKDDARDVLRRSKENPTVGELWKRLEKALIDKGDYMTFDL